MVKRLLWLLVGITVGVTLVLRTQRSLRRRGARLRPERVARDLAEAIRELGVDIRKAVEEGRTAMTTREAELREQLGPRTGADS